MVCEKNKKICKDKFLITALVLISIGFMAFVMAAGFVVRNEIDGTISYLTEDVTYAFNISINVTDYGQDANVTQVNITLPGGFTLGSLDYVNTSAPEDWTFANTSTLLSFSNFTRFLINGSTNNTEFIFNATAAKPGYYNITVTIVNGTGVHTHNISVHINDTTPPEVYEFNFSLVSFGNYSGSKLINISIFDNGGNITGKGGFPTAYINITNSSGVQNATYNISREAFNTTAWNVTITTTDFPDGHYNITLTINDSSGNKNNTAKVYQVAFDNTGPTVTLSSSSATKNSLTLTISASDALVGVNGTCTSNRPDAVISGSSSLIESSLNCGTTYPYTVNCDDGAGNLGSSTSTSFTTSSCASGGTTSGSPSLFTWSNTYVYNNKEFSEQEPLTREFAKKERVKLKIGGETHHVGVKAITTTSATIEIASDPVEIKLDVGEDAKVDVDADEVYDVYVKLNAIVNGKADLTIQSISEEIPEGEGAVSTTGEEVTPTGDGETTEDETSLTWLWILIVVVLVVVGFTIYKKRK